MRALVRRDLMFTLPSFPRKRRRFSTANAGQSIFAFASEQMDARFRGNDGHEKKSAKDLASILSI
jgi:hypothetical protein